MTAARAAFLGLVLLAAWGCREQAEDPGCSWKAGDPATPAPVVGFQLNDGDELTVLARVRRPAAMAGEAEIAGTTRWSFGLRPDGALIFSVPGKARRVSCPLPAVAPLSWDPAQAWPPAAAGGGRVPADAWTDVAVTVDSRGGWGEALGFAINGIPVPTDMGWAPIIGNGAETPLRIASASGGALELATVRVVPRRLADAEVAGRTEIPKALPEVPAGPAPDKRLIIAHRMIGIDSRFATSVKSDRSTGPYGFLFPVKTAQERDLTGFCRDGHLGALHPPFISAAEAARWEVAQAACMGIDAFAFDTCGGAKELAEPDRLLAASEALGGRFKIGLCLDFAAGTMEAKIESVREWLKRHRDSPALLRIDGKPAFISFMERRDPADVATWFAALREAAGEPIFLHQDFCQFPSVGNDAAQWAAAIQPYLAAADGIGCFFSRCGFEVDAKALTVLGSTVQAAGKRWGFSPWPNYYSPGRRVGMENIGSDNSRLWDRMWRLGIDTRADYVLLTTWNDTSEETIVMPSLRKHFAFLDLLSSYYGPWYRTGVEPAPAKDQAFIFYRPYRTDAARPRIAGPHAQASESQDWVEVRCLLTAPATVILEGAGRQEAPRGMSSLRFPARVGEQRVRVTRGGATVLAFTAPEVITDRPWREDFAQRAFGSEDERHWREWFPGEPRFISEYRDMDGNGLPNWFERYYFGCWQGTVASADPDGDGISNLEEYRLGSDPLNPARRYPAGYVWDPSRDFVKTDATFPVLDGAGAPVWEYAFRPRSGHPQLQRKEWFADARVLVSAIPAWLEWGGSWQCRIGNPADGAMTWTGEADSAASLGWIAPADLHVAITLRLQRDAKLAGDRPLTAALDHAGRTTWTAPLPAPGAQVEHTGEFTVRRGERLHLTIAGADGLKAWSTTTTCIITSLPEGARP